MSKGSCFCSKGIFQFVNKSIYQKTTYVGQATFKYFETARS